jgi:hypothetical protein
MPLHVHGLLGAQVLVGQSSQRLWPLRTAASRSEERCPRPRQMRVADPARLSGQVQEIQVQSTSRKGRRG